MLKWLPTGSCVLCGYTASWEEARWANGSQTLQVRLCQVGQSAFSAGQYVYGLVVPEAENGLMAQQQKQGHRAQGLSSHHVKKEELKV